MSDALPQLSSDERKAKVVAAAKWVKNSALASKPLVKASVQMMPDEAVRMLQLALPQPVSPDTSILLLAAPLPVLIMRRDCAQTM